MRLLTAFLLTLTLISPTLSQPGKPKNVSPPPTHSHLLPHPLPPSKIPPHTYKSPHSNNAPAATPKKKSASAPHPPRPRPASPPPTPRTVPRPVQAPAPPAASSPPRTQVVPPAPAAAPSLASPSSRQDTVSGSVRPWRASSVPVGSGVWMMRAMRTVPAGLRPIVRAFACLLRGEQLGVEGGLVVAVGSGWILSGWVGG